MNHVEYLGSLNQSAGTQQTINQKNPTNFGKVYLHSLRDFIMSIMKIDSIHIVINNISNVSYRSKDGKSISTNVKTDAYMNLCNILSIIRLFSYTIFFLNTLTLPLMSVLKL